eukprot:4680211-Karenia_brevis.AAC.1
MHIKFQESVSKTKEVEEDSVTEGFYLRRSKASKLRQENSEDDKPGKVWNDSIGCATSRDVRVQYS